MLRASDFGDLEDYAVTLLGPLLNGYFATLSDRCQTRKIPFVGFVSREGVFLDAAFKAFCNARDILQPSGNIIASRALLMKLLIDDGSIEHVAKEPFSGTLGRLLSDRFAIGCDFADRDLRMWSSMYLDLPKDREQLLSIWRMIGDQIAPRAMVKKHAYRAYLKECGLVDGSLVADVGYAGSLQSLLGWIVERPIDGFYLMTSSIQKRYKEAHTGTLQGLFEKVGVFGTGVPLLDNSLLLEVMMSSDTGQADDLGDCNGMLPWQFHYGPKGKAQHGHKIIAAAQSAVIRYITDSADVPLTRLRDPSHVAWLEDYLRLLMTLPTMAPALLVDIGEVDDRISGNDFINPWRYLAGFQ